MHAPDPRLIPILLFAQKPVAIVTHEKQGCCSFFFRLLSFSPLLPDCGYAISLLTPSLDDRMITFSSHDH
jgi:hypothetical protein